MIQGDTCHRLPARAAVLWRNGLHADREAMECLIRHHRKTWFKEMTHTDISCFISRPA